MSKFSKVVVKFVVNPCDPKNKYIVKKFEGDDLIGLYTGKLLTQDDFDALQRRGVLIECK